ncbi:MAG: YggS family pyridoxal phosphate-dependent enzyme [Fidelibacterota bacterium]
MNFAERLKTIRNRIREACLRRGLNQNVTIIAVTKTHPVGALIEAWNNGLPHIGENRVQEAAAKFPKLPSDILPVKHLIGHLQSNKINKALDLFDRLDSVDSLALAEKINRKTTVQGQIIPVLLEVNTSGETAKSGFHPDDLEAMLACLELPGIEVRGLMTVGPLTDEENTIRTSFIQLRKIQDDLNQQKPEDTCALTELSMGMSNDFELAVEEGSTMIRVGTALFGPREYSA